MEWRVAILVNLVPSEKLFLGDGVTGALMVIPLQIQGPLMPVVVQVSIFVSDRTPKFLYHVHSRAHLHKRMRHGCFLLYKFVFLVVNATGLYSDHCIINFS